MIDGNDDKLKNLKTVGGMLDQMLGGLGSLWGVFIVFWVVIVFPGMVGLYFLYKFGILN